MTCKTLIEFLIDYTSDTLPPEQRAEFDRHLAVCPPCVAYLQNYRATIELGRVAYADPKQPLDADVPDELVRAILAARPKSENGS